MSKFESLFKSFYDKSNISVAKAVFRDAITEDSVISNESLDNTPVGPQKEFFLQKEIRPLFGKSSVNCSAVGGAPSFVQFQSTQEVKEQYTCTLFVDMKGSTRLSLIYDLKEIYLFKNAVIQTCIEIIRALDGHVHRIMGDAVMAFFSGYEIDKENAIANALNCAITLRAILEKSIKPWMTQVGLDTQDFGFRIGCDFGDNKEVLWGTFGYNETGEVSATGLPVDMASKLQSLANKNQTMLGQGLLDFINWPDKYSTIKKSSGNSDEQYKVVTPNITYKNGDSLDYQMRLINYKKVLEFCALPRHIREDMSDGAVKSNPNIDYKCIALINGVREEYISASKFLNRGITLTFEATAKTQYFRFPLKVIFTKTNHGPETPEKERNVEQKTSKTMALKKTSEYDRSAASESTVLNSDCTAYRGLHTMKCEVYDYHNNLIFRDWKGVMVK